MSLELTLATNDDAPEISALRAAVAQDLTVRFGKSHWSSSGTEKGVLYDIRSSRLYILKQAGRIIATLRLATKKPWAIDRSYFTPCKRPIFLTSMAVHPEMQGRGIGRKCVEEARRLVREWPGNAIFLDAYDAPAGAGKFYQKCGFREVGRVTYRNVPLIYYEMLIPAR